jgi:ABC-type multidrug transport system fused ATPase/permease subunit
MGRLLGYLGRYRVRLACGVACLLAATTLTMSVPWLNKRVVDTIAAGGDSAAVVRLVILLLGVVVFEC